MISDKVSEFRASTLRIPNGTRTSKEGVIRASISDVLNAPVHKVPHLDQVKSGGFNVKQPDGTKFKNSPIKTQIATSSQEPSPTRKKAPIKIDKIQKKTSDNFISEAQKELLQAYQLNKAEDGQFMQKRNKTSYGASRKQKSNDL